jgi:acetyl esterase/lipase
MCIVFKGFAVSTLLQLIYLIPIRWELVDYWEMQMKLEDIVTSLELSKKLKELGVKQESFLYWVKLKHDFDLFFYQESVFDIPQGESCSAYTAAELLEHFEDSVNVIKNRGAYIEYLVEYADIFTNDFQSAANALAKMLIYLIENNLIKL